MACSKPFRLLQLPLLAHDVIFSLMSIGDVYHLSKCSTRSRNAVKMFTRRQSYFFTVTVDKYYYGLGISSHERKKTFCHELRPKNYRKAVDDSIVRATGLTYWAAAQEEILYFLDVFTRQVNRLRFENTTKVIEITEFLKRATPSPIEYVYYGDKLAIIDDEVYKYVLKEFKNAKSLYISAPPSSELRFDEVGPFTGEYISIVYASWVTVDHLIRCFPNAEEVSLLMNPDECLLTPQLMPQFFNAWRNGSKMRELEWECNVVYEGLEAMLENVPKTEVERAEVRWGKEVFQDGECFLIRQEESGVEAIAFMHFDKLYFTTDFRLLSDDEPDSDSEDNSMDAGSNQDEREDPDSDDDRDNDLIEAEPGSSDSSEDSDNSDDHSNQDEEERYPDSDDDSDDRCIEAEPANSDSYEPFTGDEIFLRDANWVTVDHVIGCFSNIEKVGLQFNTELSLITPASMNHLLKVWQKEWRIKDLELACDWSYDEFQSIFENITITEVKQVEINYIGHVFEEGQCFLIRQEESGMELISYMSYDRDDGGPVFYFKTNFRLLRDDQSVEDSDDSDAGSNQDEGERYPDTDEDSDDRDKDFIEAEAELSSDSDDDRDNNLIVAEPWSSDSDEDL